ncbi:MAG: hypothetical protein HGA42_20225 [Nostocales cyanobacterium W4_Combined_metabat2_030]|nr:hypothetical protein [Nostocales cyanobacterium W4_Combined_metabat2_030]
MVKNLADTLERLGSEVSKTERYFVGLLREGEEGKIIREKITIIDLTEMEAVCFSQKITLMVDEKIRKVKEVQEVFLLTYPTQPLQ